MRDSFFNLECIKRICLSPIRAFGNKDFQKRWFPLHNINGGFTQVETKDGVYYYLDRGASVLAVAHLDSVAKPSHFNYDSKARKLYCPTLDDRLGAGVILNTLEEYIPGEYDILLTEGEEMGQSTAQHFTPSDEARARYNWMFSFDRGGCDAVHYQYQSPRWKEALEEGLGVNVSHGMFSDLSFMGHVGVSGVNVGTAYYNYHSTKAFSLLNELEEMVLRFLLFHASYKDERFIHTAEDEEEYNWNSWSGRNWNYYSGRRETIYLNSSRAKDERKEEDYIVRDRRRLQRVMDRWDDDYDARKPSTFTKTEKSGISVSTEVKHFPFKNGQVVELSFLRYDADYYDQQVECESCECAEWVLYEWADSLMCNYCLNWEVAGVLAEMDEADIPINVKDAREFEVVLEGEEVTA